MKPRVHLSPCVLDGVVVYWSARVGDRLIGWFWPDKPPVWFGR